MPLPPSCPMVVAVSGPAGIGKTTLALRRAHRACAELSLSLTAALDDQYHVATVLDHLGDAWLGADDAGRARAMWTRALVILHKLDHPDAAGLRGKLAVPPRMRPTGT